MRDEDRATSDATMADPAAPGADPAAATLAGGATPAGPTIADQTEVAATLAGPPPSAPARRAIPIVEGYEILGELGRGAMGVVYRAREVRLNRPCALKMILAAAHADHVAAVRFLAEAEAVARLTHPNVVQIHHIGEAEGLPFFELEYVDGGSLDRRLDGTPWPPRRAAALIEALARGVAEAHRLGIVHRDLKPSNILVTAGGTPKVADFGLAKSIGADPGLTRTDSILGSPSYMAPEQARGLVREVGPRADVYSLGAILYELLTGRPPFKAATVLETLELVRLAEPVPPSRLVPGLPRDAETIALKCLEKDPMRRYDSAEALADDLGRFLGGEPIRARPVMFWERGIKWARRRPAVAALIVAVHVLLAALLGLGVASYAEIHRALGQSEVDRRAAEESSRQAMRERAASEEARERAVAETYHALASETRALRLSREPGWRTEALANLGRLAAMETQARDPVRLRTEAVACLGELDARPVTTIGSANFGAWGLGFSPDGKSLAINDDKTARVVVWDLAAGEVARSVPKASGFAPFAFRPDGSCLAYAAPGNRVAFEPMAGGAEPPPPLEGPSPAIALAFDGPGRRLAVAWGQTDPGYRGVARTCRRADVYELGPPAGPATLRRSVDGPFDPINYKVPLALSPDGSALAVIGAGHAVQVYRVEGGDPPATLGRHRSQVVSMSFDPRGAYLATGGHAPDPVVKVWDVAERREHLALHGHTTTVWGLAFSPDGERIASTANDDTLRIWDARDGRERIAMPTGVGPNSLALAFAPGGERIAVGSRQVAVIGLEGLRERRTLAGHGYVLGDVAFHPTRPELASVGSDRRLILWDLPAGRPRRTAGPTPLPIGRLQYGPAGEWLALGMTRFDMTPDSADFSVRLADGETGALGRSLRGPTNVILSMACDPSGRRLAAGSRDGSATVWDVATGDVFRRIPLGGPVRFVAFLPGGTRLLAGVLGGRLALVDLDDGRTVREASIAGTTWAFALSPGGDRLALGCGDGTIRLVGLPGLDLLPPVEKARAGELAYHPGGRVLASAGQDHRVVFHDATTLRPLFEVAVPLAEVRGLAFRPDGGALAICGTSEDVFVWDLALLRSELAPLGLDWGAPAGTGTEE